MTVFLLYWYLPVSALYVANSDAFRDTNCIDMRLDIGHRPYFSDKKYINSIPVINTETRRSTSFRNNTYGWSPSFCNNTYGWSPCAWVVFDNPIRLHAPNICINHFLCSWIDDQTAQLVSASEILLQQKYIYPVVSGITEKTERYFVHRSSNCVCWWSFNVDLLNVSWRAAAKSVLACKLFKCLFATALATFSGIAVTGDVGLTTVFGWIVMFRSDEIQACTRPELVLVNQLATVLATIKECQISSWGMSFVVCQRLKCSVRSALTYLFEVLLCWRHEWVNDCFMRGWYNVLIRNIHRGIFCVRVLRNYRTVP